MSNNIEQQFNELSDGLFNVLLPDEHLSLSLNAESSQFTRINGAKIRQTGQVDDASIALELTRHGRRCSSCMTLSGDIDTDREALANELNRLRDEVMQLPEDPFIVLPVGGQNSHTEQHGHLLPTEQSAEKLLPPMQGVDLSGIWASGRIYRGNANSAGSRHWFATDSFALDYSLVNADEKMVKATYAGAKWDQADYELFLASSIDQLKVMDRPSVRIKPGHYRTYIASAGVSDLLGMFSWNGLSELSMQTGESAFCRMRQESLTLSPLFSVAEDFSSGLVPRFNDNAEVSPQRVELINAGALKNCLVSSRTAKEYGVESNFASEGEWLRSPVMATGGLDEADVLQALGTGVYLSNLHYLNWSDTPGGRITGMTRYACFWVENGEIVGPIENMRFDDSLYHFFGDKLEAVSSQSKMNPDVGTYGGRSLGVTECPGILLSEFALTL